uniref:Uncharacterized protein n=1 Tax=Peronospora matthiolae TaxID=2874970 RepID=A0AAV1VCT2_9STRA
MRSSVSCPEALTWAVVRRPPYAYQRTLVPVKLVKATLRAHGLSSDSINSSQQNASTRAKSKQLFQLAKKPSRGPPSSALGQLLQPSPTHVAFIPEKPLKS